MFILPSRTCQHHFVKILEASWNSSKAIKQALNPCLSSPTFSRCTLITTSDQSYTNNGFFKLIMFLFRPEAMKYVDVRCQNSLSPCITCVQHSHAAKRMLPGLPDRNKKLLPNSLQKKAKLAKIPKRLEMVASLPKRYIFALQISRSKVFYLLFYILSESQDFFNILQTFLHNQFQHFASILYLIRMAQYHASTFEIFTLWFVFMNFQMIRKPKNSKSAYNYAIKTDKCTGHWLHFAKPKIL